ncbi:SasC/FmtB family protein [Staphylococcus aureus]|uniref:SasC/FmtB family protein n=1 Tax=Staphylococcus aureus TaxID=1280 RepID=UPI00244AF857|nr:SasC/FmtB family protein [Staphylococcus aureus]
MNLFRQQKFSIRKFNVGIFSALIATVTFISINPTTASAAEQNQPAQNQPAQPADPNAQPNANAGAQANPTAQPAAPANQGGQADPAANQGGQANPAGGAVQPAAGTTQPAGQGNQADPNNAAQAQPGNQAAPANQAGQGNNQATPNNNATPANQTQPANAPAGAQPAAAVAANGQTQDPNASNTGEGSINTTLTFDDPAISTDENRQDPTVTVTDKVNGYSLINNGKIGFVNSELRRSDMFDKNNPQNYQARGNVAALGRVNANDSTDHGNFNGISKTVNVKPDSELIINFTTMQTNSKQGATNLVIKDAKKNTELATVNVAKTGTAHLFKVPTDADRLDLQFIPDNTAVADASRITTNKDGYKYYSFIDNVGLFSGSHLYVKNRDLAPKATNNKEYTINTEIGNNGNFGASLKADQFKYEVTLPQGVTYVNDSLTTTFPNGNEDSTVLKNMTVNYDQTANKVTFTSQGVTTARGTHTKEVLFPDKSLKLSYKVNIANIDTPKNIDFNEKLTYRTASDVVINNAQPEVTLTADPFSVAVEMNKDALQQQVNSQVDNSHYTTASIAEYNKLKQQADTILNEDAKQAIATKANERKTAIAQTQDITAEEIAAANADVDNAVIQANSNIEAANSQNDVDQAKTTGETSIDQVTPTVNKKATARNEITTTLNNKLQEIQATPDATDEEKQDAETEANTENAKANQAITAATTNAEVDEAKTNAEAAINAVTPKVMKKQAAKDEIDQLQAAQTAVINNDQNATNEEKEAAIQQLATAVTDAKNNITAATDNNGVDTAKDAGKNSIQSTQPATAVKSNAKNDVDQAVTTQNQAIDNTTGATTEEKNAAKDLVSKAKEKAYQDILNAQTTNDVTQLKDQAVADIQGITADTTIKDVAKGELTAKANEQKALIAQTADATTEEKEQANQQVDAQLTQGNQNIENAQSIDDVNTAKDNAVQAIDPIQASTDVKTNARAELLNEMQNKITEILNDNTTTNEEKGKDIGPVRAAYEEGLNNINVANSTGDVTTAKDAAVQKVQQLHANPVKKPAGKTELDQAAADKKTQIEQTPNASQQEINDAKQEVDTELNQAKTNIDQSSTDDYVDAAVRDGKAKINAVKTFSEYKKDALAKIADAYNAKVNEADNSNASTSSEIAEAKQKLAELKQTADQNVNQATSKDDIEVQIHNDLDNINDYTIPTGKKESATTDLYAYADQKKNNISADTNATQDEKQQAIKQVDQNVQTALESINNGVDNSDVDDALTQGKATIDAVQVDATVKAKANQAIDAKAQETKESIDQSDQLTAEEKTEALATIKQITDQAKQGITDATTTAEVEKAKAQGLEAFDNIQIDSTEKQKAIEELETALDQIEAGVNVDSDATTEEKEVFTNALEEILSKATEDISDQTTNAEIATVKNSALEQLKAQRINPEVKKNALEAIREVVNKQIEIIKNADADASAKEIARTDLGRYFDRFADDLDKTQTNAEVAELQNVTIPAIEAIVPQNDPDANHSSSDNNDATANTNVNAEPDNAGQPNVTESTDNANADTSSTTTNNHNDAATGETTATSTNNSSTDDANDKPTANNNSSVDASIDNSATGNGTTDKPATTESTEKTSSADSKDNASVNDSNQNAEVNNSAESQPTNGKVAQPKSENKAKVEKDGRDSTNQSMVESTTETLPSADITEPNVPSNTSKDKEESTSNQTDAGQLKSETNVASNEADKSPSKADTEVSNKPSTSASSEAKDKMTSTEDSQKADMATADTKDNQASIGSSADANNKATQNDGANASPATVSNGSNSANQDMLNVTKPEENKANAKSDQQGKVNKPKQQAKTLPDTGMSHNDDLPYAELALGAGMAFLIRRFTKKDQQTEE